MNIKLETSWENLLCEELEQEYFQNIILYLEKEIKSGKTIYPSLENIFAAFNYTPLEKLKVVILGQDPYHGAWQAHGLSFSVQDGVKVPPSLKNIYKEIKNEGLPSPVRRGAGGEVSGDLSHWAEQWILLLNSILTVEAGKPASHSKIGWWDFTDAIIQKISDSQQWIIFVLWGNFSRWKKVLIDSDKHFILESPHPSPFSAHSWFFGSWHFKEINEILRQGWKEEIKW